MNATSNPQTAAEQGRKNYRDVTTADAAVPETVRAMVEKAVDQSRWSATASSRPGQEEWLTRITQPRCNSRASPWRHATRNPEVAANNARDKKAAMDYLAHAQAAMDARD